MLYYVCRYPPFSSRCSSVAEQRFRKPQVKGSTPFTGSIASSLHSVPHSCVARTRILLPFLRLNFARTASFGAASILPVILLAALALACSAPDTRPTADIPQEESANLSIEAAPIAIEPTQPPPSATGIQPQTSRSPSPTAKAMVSNSDGPVRRCVPCAFPSCHCDTDNRTGLHRTAVPA